MKTISFLTSAVLCGAVHFSSAATATWKGGTIGTPDVWGIQQNWVGNTGPGTADHAVFPAGAPFLGTVVGIDHNINSMAVNAPGYAFQAAGIIGAALQVSAGITVTFGVTGSTTFLVPVNLGADQVFNANGSRITLLWNQPLLLNGQTLTLAGTGIHECNGAIAGAGNIIKTGTGRVEINSAMSGGGGVSVQDGTMMFNHATMSRTVNLSATGVVAGTGTMTSLVASGGTVRPGINSTGTLTVLGSVLLGSGSVLEMEFAGNAPGNTDLLKAGSSVTLNNAALDFTTGGTWSPRIGTPRTLIENNGANPVNGTFAGLAEGATVLAGNVSYRISYAGGDGNDVTLTPIAAAPTGLTRVWNGGHGTQWTTSANWNDGQVPLPGDSVIIPPLNFLADQPNVNLSDGFPLHRITLTGSGIELTGGAVFLSDGIVQQAPAGSLPNLIVCGLHTPAAGSPAGETRILLQSGGSLTVDGVPAFGLPSAAGSLRLENGMSGAVLTFQQPIGSGPGLISKFGPGRVVLGNAATHSGGVRVREGRLQLNHSSAAGTGTVIVDAFTGLALGHSSVGSLTFVNPLQLAGELLTTPGSADQVWQGSITTSSSSAKISTDGGALVLGRTLMGTGGFVFSGSETITIGGNAPGLWDGPTLISGVSVVCSKDVGGLLAIPGNVTVTGANGYLSCLKSNSLGDGATVTVSDGALVKFWQPHILSTLDLTGANAATGGTGTLAIAGGITSHAAAQSSTITGTCNTLTSPVTWHVEDGAAPHDLVFTGSLGHLGVPPAAIALTGSGLVRVNDGVSTHTDVTFTVSAGTLQWNDHPNLPGVFGPEVIVNGGALTGDGRVRGITATNGIVSPGVVAGYLTCDSLTMSGGATYLAEFSGGMMDQLLVEGPVDLGNATLVLSGTALPYGLTWRLIDNRSLDAVRSTFAGLNEGGTTASDGALLQISYQAEDRNNVVLTRITPPAPELVFFNLADGIAGTGPVTFEGLGLPGFAYRLEYSDDLQQWFTAQDAAGAPADGSVKLEWLPPAVVPRLFFRVRTL